VTRTCTVCSHKDIEEINRLLLTGESYRDIAGQYKLSKSAVERHYNGNLDKNEPGHIAELLSKSEDVKEIVNADSLFERLQEEAVFVREMRVSAAAEGNIELALKAVDRALRCIELYAKIDGRIREQSVNIIQQNVLINNPEWISLRTLIVKALEPYPQAREAVVHAIRE
jgi:hypothetical protein